MRPKAPRKQSIRQKQKARQSEPKPSKVNTETLPEDYDPRIVDFLESQDRLAELINQFCIEFRLRFPFQEDLTFRASNATIAVIFDEAEEEVVH